MTNLEDLVSLSVALGQPALDAAILGEGNTSTAIDEQRFYVKASGRSLGTIDASGFLMMDRAAVRGILDLDAPNDAAVLKALEAARVDKHAKATPSVETMLHAVCLDLDGVEYVGHTHPTAINAITCANDFDAMYAGRVFPDEVVVCGPAPLLVPYVDPGLLLAREVKTRLGAFIAEYGRVPKQVILQNHGLIALGASPREVMSITRMSIKAARTLAGTRAFGGPNFLPQSEIDRIDGRLDEAIRRAVIERDRG